MIETARIHQMGPTVRMLSYIQVPPGRRALETVCNHTTAKMGHVRMELNRNHYLAVGTIVLLLGLQLRFVESVRLTKETTRFLAERFDKSTEQVEPMPLSALLSVPATGKSKTIHPPRWLGWSLLSLGAVLVLHSLTMRKPS